MFRQTFDTPASPKAFAAAYPDLATRFRFGTQLNPGEKWPDGSLVTKAQAVSSRTFPGILNIQTDHGFDPAQSFTPKAMNGALYLDAYKPGKPYSADKPFYTAMVSPKQSFLYGKFTVRMLAPINSGCWAGVWLFAYDKATRHEIDFMEMYGGNRTVMSGSPPQPYVIEQAGKPFASVHWVEPGDATAKWQTLTSGRQAPISYGWHTFGGVWTPDYISAEIDGREIWRVPNPGLHSPMWLIVDMDVSESAGPVAGGKYPSFLAVQSITVEPL